MNSEGEPLAYSNWGSLYQTQGLLAPGEEIEGAIPGGGISTGSGTSFATPIVSGVAALLLSLLSQRGRKPDAAAVRQALLRSSLGCEYQTTAECRRLLAGRLDVRGAVSTIASGDFRMPDQVKENGTTATAGKEIGPSNGQEATTPVPNGKAQTTDSAGLGLATAARQVTPSACSCGGTAPTQLVFALGQLGYDFGTEARRDSLIQNMQEPASGVQPNPYDPNQLLAYLDRNPWEAASLIWTLNLDATAIYAVVPSGPFAGDAYQKLSAFLKDQLKEGVDRVSIPGRIVGQVRLFNGQIVPSIQPEIRGMFSWTTSALVEAVVGKPPDAAAPAEEKAAHAKKAKGVDDFLDRVYFELRNLGLTPQERAINYAATNAFSIESVYETALKEDMDLDTIEVERSPICRTDSDCWDVKLLFFFPERQVQTVRRAYRFTVDVSDVVPVTVGPVRSWFVR
jgi:hypothetical protein